MGCDSTDFRTFSCEKLPFKYFHCRKLVAKQKRFGHFHIARNYVSYKIINQ